MQDHRKQSTAVSRRRRRVSAAADAPEANASSASLLLLLLLSHNNGQKELVQCAVVLAASLARNTGEASWIHTGKKSWKALPIRDTGCRIISSLVPGRPLVLELQVSSVHLLHGAFDGSHPRQRHAGASWQCKQLC